MEEDEGPPSLLPQRAPSIPHLPQGHDLRTSTLTRVRFPLTPAMEEPLRRSNSRASAERPHSVHGALPTKHSIYALGSITTQIKDQDGYRATRVPITNDHPPMMENSNLNSSMNHPNNVFKSHNNQPFANSQHNIVNGNTNEANVNPHVNYNNNGRSFNSYKYIEQNKISPNNNQSHVNTMIARMNNCSISANENNQREFADRSNANLEEVRTEL